MSEINDRRNKTQFVAVIYVNRSGSTLFSRLVSDQFSDVCVFPELSFPIQLLIERSKGRTLSGAALYEAIVGDPRSEALGIAAPELHRICASNSSADLPRLCNSLASGSRAGRPYEAILFKLETLLDIAQPLIDSFPGIKFIHVVRDPRAVASSMLRTPVPEKPGFNMARDSVVYAARHWRRYIRRVEALARVAPVMTVEYETLGDGFPQIAAQFQSFLDLKSLGPSGVPATNTYVTAAIDAEIHQNIHQPFIPDRINGWADELSPRQVGIIEALCRNEMTGLGYAPIRSMLRYESIVLPLANIRYAGTMVRHFARTLRHYMGRKDALRALRQRGRRAVAKRFS